jgi:hypothetical protein
MKRTVILTVLCGLGALIFGGCAFSVGEDFTTAREIVDYNLESYVPIPVAGEPAIPEVNSRRDLRGTVTWKDQTGNPLPNPYIFLPDMVYQGEITLIPRDGYRFNPTIAFAYYPGRVTDQADDLGSLARTITVTYNNSNDGNLTYIVDYNLENYVPVPVGLEDPIWVINAEGVTGTVIWKEGGVPLERSAVFHAGGQYTADITLEVRPGYRFRPERDFGYPSNTVAVQPVSNRDLSMRDLGTVRYQDAKLRMTDLDLSGYILEPVAGETPAAAGFTSPGNQYTAGGVTWEPVDAVFAAGHSYTARVTLTAHEGYTFTGGNFTHNDGVVTVVNSDTDSITLEIAFAQARDPWVVTDLTLSGKITAPVVGEQPNPTFGNSSSQYTGGTVTWYITGSPSTEVTGSFRRNGFYTARVTLSTERGYTFTGAGPFIYTANMSGITMSISANTGDTVTVDIIFPELTITTVTGSW